MKKILVALDGSPTQDGVLAQAVVIAQATGARLVLFRAVSAPTALPAEALSMSPDDLPRLLLKNADAELARLAARVPAATLEAVRAEVGTPWKTVVDAAAREMVDLVVVGSHGYGGIDRLLGTTAAKIVDHAACSVLVARRVS